MIRLSYRLRYYWRKICHFFGRCPKCYNEVNVTRSGASICPHCGSR